VQVAMGAPALSHSIYVDDLILFGMTEMVEIEEFKHTLDKFGRESGLMVNPVKYTMWFSKRCFEACRRDILAVFEAKCTGLKKEYLGIGIPTSRRGSDDTREVLIEKC
jgi:hypothetical protein